MTLSHSTVEYDSEKRLLICRGDWSLQNLPTLQSSLRKINLPTSGAIKIDGHAIEKMDSAGAWLLGQWQKKLADQHVRVRLLKFSPQGEKLLALITKEVKEEKPLPINETPKWLARIGLQAEHWLDEFRKYLAFIGQLSYEALRILRSPSHLRWGSLASVVYRNGYQALPIIALLSFMIGVVITYQMGLQLRNYGANVYIVDLLGLSILREFGPLITAIMVAGRTGSAFTAQLGSMKTNQEIDALDTMGVTPAELLLLPRIVGLFIALPLLTVWADIFGVLGGMVMSNNMLNITWYDFLHRFPHVIPLRAFLIGLGKAPIFALIISTIGCFQGVQVEGNATSVGLNTTRSVVLSIFFIIVADAIFSIIFSKLQL
jgi:phospholipid/cholesterol/gamma-HCH transport system permease protein